jgi:hypothetical protein
MHTPAAAIAPTEKNAEAFHVAIPTYLRAFREDRLEHGPLSMQPIADLETQAWPRLLDSTRPNG